MMKAGDKLYCKKSSYYFNESKTYYIASTNSYSFLVIQTINNNYITYSQKLRFLKYQEPIFNIITFGDPYIWDHFYTPQEIRNLKLEQLKMKAR